MKRRAKNNNRPCDVSDAGHAGSESRCREPLIQINEGDAVVRWSGAPFVNLRK
jgi:hypothetical protein